MKQDSKFGIVEEVGHSECLILFLHDPECNECDVLVKTIQIFPHIWEIIPNRHRVRQYTGT